MSDLIDSKKIMFLSHECTFNDRSERNTTKSRILGIRGKILRRSFRSEMLKMAQKRM